MNVEGEKERGTEARLTGGAQVQRSDDNPRFLAAVGQKKMMQRKMWSPARATKRARAQPAKMFAADFRTWDFAGTLACRRRWGGGDLKFDSMIVSGSGVCSAARLALVERGRRARLDIRAARDIVQYT